MSHVQMAISQEGGTFHSLDPLSRGKAAKPLTHSPLHTHQPQPASDIDQSENQSYWTRPEIWS